MADQWWNGYLTGELAPTASVTEAVGVADPMVIVGAVLEALSTRGVPVVMDHSLERAVEAAERLLRCLGVEALDAWAVTP